jgi:hypothetical protein
MSTRAPARLREVTPEEASHYLEEVVIKPPKRDPGFMVIPGVGMVSRGCHGTTQAGKKCQMMSPWDWSPEQGDWYCRVHKHQETREGTSLPTFVGTER